jgi:hypothetical protein
VHLAHVQYGLADQYPDVRLGFPVGPYEFHDVTIAGLARRNREKILAPVIFDGRLVKCGRRVNINFKAPVELSNKPGAAYRASGLWSIAQIRDTKHPLGNAAGIGWQDFHGLIPASPCEYRVNGLIGSARRTKTRSFNPAAR